MVLHLPPLAFITYLGIYFSILNHLQRKRTRWWKYAIKKSFLKYLLDLLRVFFFRLDFFDFCFFFLTWVTFLLSLHFRIILLLHVRRQNNMCKWDPSTLANFPCQFVITSKLSIDLCSCLNTGLQFANKLAKLEAWRPEAKKVMLLTSVTCVTRTSGHLQINSLPVLISSSKVDLCIFWLKWCATNLSWGTRLMRDLCGLENKWRVPVNATDFSVSVFV